LRKISAKGPYMVLEAFLLIHMMGGSSTCYDTESNNICLLYRSTRLYTSERYIQTQDLDAKNTKKLMFIFEARIAIPDTIKEADSIRYQKKASSKFDSVQPFSHQPILFSKNKNPLNIAPEISNPEKIHELPNPEFALTYKQNRSIPLKNFTPESSELRIMQHRGGIFKQLAPFDFNENIIPNLKINKQRDWFSIILLLCVLLIAGIRSFFGRYFQQSIQSLYNFTLSTRLFRNKNVLLPRISFLLLVNFVIISSLFTFKALEIINTSLLGTSFSKFLLLNFIFFILIALRFLSFHGLNILFPKSQLIMEYHYQVQNFYKSIGILIIPILIMVTYMPISNHKVLVWTGVGVIIFLYIYRLFRGQRIVHRRSFTISYLSLFLITFEILPISICYKIFSEII
jgi:hypothetical protein